MTRVFGYIFTCISSPITTSAGSNQSYLQSKHTHNHDKICDFMFNYYKFLVFLDTDTTTCFLLHHFERKAFEAFGELRVPKLVVYLTTCQISVLVAILPFAWGEPLSNIHYPLCEPVFRPNIFMFYPLMSGNLDASEEATPKLNSKSRLISSAHPRRIYKTLPTLRISDWTLEWEGWMNSVFLHLCFFLGPKSSDRIGYKGTVSLEVQVPLKK